jgi:hypothetical protein
MAVSLMGSLTANRCNATAITQPNASQLTDNTQRAEPHGKLRPAIVQQHFVLAADLQIDFNPKQMKDNGSVAKITPPWTPRQDKTASPRRRSVGLKSECSPIAAWHCSKTGGVTQERTY